MSADYRDDYYGDILSNREAWTPIAADPDSARDAIAWLTETIQDVLLQLSSRRSELGSGRIPDDVWAEYHDWRTSALGFKRLCEQRKRELVTAVKDRNRSQEVRLLRWQSACVRLGHAIEAHQAEKINDADLYDLLDALVVDGAGSTLREVLARRTSREAS